MPDLLVELDGATVRLSGCQFVLWAVCGCPQGVVVAGRDVVTEEHAWKVFFDLKRDRVRAQRDGLRLELMTHARYCAEVSPLMTRRCPHTLTTADETATNKEN